MKSTVLRRTGPSHDGTTFTSGRGGEADGATMHSNGALPYIEVFKRCIFNPYTSPRATYKRCVGDLEPHDRRTNRGEPALVRPVHAILLISTQLKSTSEAHQYLLLQ